MPRLPVEQFDAWSSQLVALYGRAEVDLRRTIASALTTPYNRRRAELLLQQVESILDSLRQGQQGWSERVLPRSYRAGRRLAAEALRFPVLPQMTLVQRRAVEAAIGRVAVDTSEALSSVAPFARRVWYDSAQRIVSEPTIASLAAEGRVAGIGPRELGRRIQQTLRDGAVDRLRGHVDPEEAENLQRVARGQFITILCKDGKRRSYNLRNYSDMVAQATSRMAATEGTITQTLDFGGDLVAWSVSANPCSECLSRQGNVYSLTGRNPDFPVLSDEDRPPIHPYCQHALVPADEDGLRAAGVYERLSRFSQSDETVENGVQYASMLRRARGQRELAA